MKTFALGVWIIVYGVWFIYYMDNFEHHRLPYEPFKGASCVIMSLGGIIPLVDEWHGYSDDLNRYVNYMARLCASIIFLVFACHFMHIFNDTYAELYGGLVLIVIEIIILLSQAYRKGYFKRNIA